MEIIHHENNCQFTLTHDGYTARVDYAITRGQLDIRHTLVPQPIAGKGIASMLVKAACDYALRERLQPVATCSYAVKWLERHPEYQGSPSGDYAGPDTCAL